MHLVRAFAVQLRLEAKSLLVFRDGSRISPMSSKPGSGWSSHSRSPVAQSSWLGALGAGRWASGLELMSESLTFQELLSEVLRLLHLYL